jgi:hypothetical protein
MDYNATDSTDALQAPILGMPISQSVGIMNAFQTKINQLHSKV